MMDKVKSHARPLSSISTNGSMTRFAPSYAGWHHKTKCGLSKTMCKGGNA